MAEDPANTDPTGGGMFLFLCLAVGVLTRSFLGPAIGLPYTVLLLIAGGVLGAIQTEWSLGPLSSSISLWSHLEPHLVLFVFLPALIFGSAFSVDYHTFSREIPQMLVLAVPGVIASALLTSCFAVYALPYKFDWFAGMAFGAMMSATDPVAVVALLRELGASKRLSLLIEGESLFNDGTAFVLFIVFQEAMFTKELSAGETIGTFAKLAVGGVALGILCGLAAMYLLEKIHFDTVSEITVTLFACYGTFLIAEGTPLHVSGVLAVVALGLVMSASARTAVTEHHSMHHFWEMMEYFANTIIFILAGIIIVEKGFYTHTITSSDWGWMFLLYVVLHVVRLLVVTLHMPLLARLGYGIHRKDAAVIIYSGLRGAVGLALALILNQDEKIPQLTRDLFAFHMAGIAGLTLLINGSTTGYLVTYLGMAKPSSASQIMFRNAVNHITVRTEETLARLRRNEFYGDADWTQVATFLPELVERVDDEITRLENKRYVSAPLKAAGTFVRKATMSVVRQRRGSKQRERGGSASDDLTGSMGVGTFVDDVDMDSDGDDDSGRGGGARRGSADSGTGDGGGGGHGAAALGVGGTPRSGLPGGQLALGQLNASTHGVRGSPARATSPPGGRHGHHGHGGGLHGHAGPGGGPHMPDGPSFQSRARIEEERLLSEELMQQALAGTAGGQPVAAASLFALKRVGTIKDNKEAFKAEARHRYLNLIKAQYWSQYEDGMVGKNSVTQLLSAASYSQDNVHLPLHEWKHVDEELRRSRATVGCLSRPALYRGIGRRFLFAPLLYEFDVCTSFIIAHRDVENVFRELVENDVVSSQILAESRMQVRHARYVVDDIVEHFPEVTRAIKTQQVVRALLKDTKNVASELLHHGEIEEKEHERILGCVSAAYKNAKVPMAIGLPSKEDLLDEVGLLKDLEPTRRKLVTRAATEQVYPKGSTLVRQGQNCTGFYVIVRGSVTLKRVRGRDAGVLEVGEDGSGPVRDVSGSGTAASPSVGSAQFMASMGTSRRGSGVFDELGNNMAKLSASFKSSAPDLLNLGSSSRELLKKNSSPAGNGSGGGGGGTSKGSPNKVHLAPIMSEGGPDDSESKEGAAAGAGSPALERLGKQESGGLQTGIVKPAWSRADDDPSRIKHLDGSRDLKEEVLVERLHKGAVVGLLSLLTGQPQLTTAVCESSVDAFYVEESKVFKLLRSRKLDGLRAVSPLERNLCRMAGVISAEVFLPRFRTFPQPRIARILDEAQLLRPHQYAPIRLHSHAILLSGTLLKPNTRSTSAAAIKIFTAGEEGTAMDLAAEDVEEVGVISDFADAADSRGASASNRSMAKAASFDDDGPDFDPNYTTLETAIKREAEAAARGEPTFSDFVPVHNAFYFIDKEPSVIRWFSPGTRLLLIPSLFEEQIKDQEATHSRNIRMHRRLSAIFRLGTLKSLRNVQGNKPAAWEPGLPAIPGGMAEGDEEDESEAESGADGGGDGGGGGGGKAKLPGVVPASSTTLTVTSTGMKPVSTDAAEAKAAAGGARRTSLEGRARRTSLGRARRTSLDGGARRSSPEGGARRTSLGSRARRTSLTRTADGVSASTTKLGLPDAAPESAPPSSAPPIVLTNSATPGEAEAVAAAAVAPVHTAHVAEAPAAVERAPGMVASGDAE